MNKSHAHLTLFNSNISNFNGHNLAKEFTYSVPSTLYLS